ncbi:MAG: cytochrome c biogenesis protein ResB [Fimbriimonadaceae bacterium]|nr:cytochrome c biogenesis protein ResB [Fimbriimonadaceae bacterium]
MIRSHPRRPVAPAKEQAAPRDSEAFWQGRLGYSQAVVVCAVAFAFGMAMHASIGYRLPATLNPFVWLMALAVPVSLVVGRVGRHNRIVHWLTGIPMAVTTTTAVGILALIGGVVPESWFQQRMGVESMWGSWPFLVLVDLMMVNLCGSVGKRIWPLTYSNIVYQMSHLGLAISIAGGAIGAVTLERHIMVLFPGQPMTIAYARDESEIKLPFEVELKEFQMDFFPPQAALARLDPSYEDGFDLVPYGGFLGQGTSHRIAEDKVEVQQFRDGAVYAGDEGWKHAPWKTTGPAAKVKVTLPDGTGETGWIAAGAADTPQSHLRISDGLALVMLDPKPKEFRSLITIRHQGREIKKTLKVNEPITVEGWTLYQLSYDDKAGKASAYSTLEVVRDHGLPVVYLGMALMVLGACLHLWNGVGGKAK